MDSLIFPIGICEYINVEGMCVSKAHVTVNDLRPHIVSLPDHLPMRIWALEIGKAHESRFCHFLWQKVPWETKAAKL